MYLVRPVRAQRERGGGADSKNLANHKKKNQINQSDTEQKKI
jgi:hypothetical protein